MTIETALKQICGFLSSGLFSEAEESELYICGRPFRRPTRGKDLPYIDLQNPLALSKLATNSALALHRLLFNIYEGDILFLPTDEHGWNDFQEFYSEEASAAADVARPHLEYLLFHGLSREVDVHGNWNARLLTLYFQDFLRQERRENDSLGADPALDAILRSNDPSVTAKHYLIQLAPDFLSEASAMARLAPGAYGDLQSALFNVLVDEYGAAVHAAKHSTLFEKTMGSVGLSADPHHYWQFYQPSALALTNYFHYLARNKRHFFRYLGALFFTETVLINVTRRQAAMLETVFGNAIDKRYFDEHRHIDQHHSQMVLKRLIEPAAAKYGAVAIKEIVRGFEEFRLLQTVADVDLVNQLTWAGRLSKESAEVKSYLDYARQSRDLEQETFVERLGERSTTHIHPDNRLLMIETGEMDFYPLAGSTLHLRPGDVLFIPQGRLHGSVVCTEICTYHQPIVPPADAVALSIAA